MGAMKFIFKAILFFIGLAAIVVMLGVGVLFFRNNDQQHTAITLTETDVSVGRNPESLEDFVTYAFLQVQADNLNKPASDDPSPVAFTIEAGESALSVAERLQEIELINDATLFRRFLRYNQLDVSLEAGDYELRRNMTIKEIGATLQKARFDEVVVTIPEGWRAEQIAETLTAEGIMDGSQFLIAVRQPANIDHPVLANHPSGQSYEGYLFPDTYRLPLNAQPSDLLSRMLDNMASKLPNDAVSLAQRQGLTFYDVLILASIVEREAVIAEERSVIASVYLNRLQPGSPEQHLRADPTVQYAMGYQPDADQWWKTPVTLEEYSLVDSPYNTYLYAGLPPGPIANPGIASIMAVLQPAETNYLYFVCRRPLCEGGEHVFAETYEQHLQNVATYQGQ